MSTGAGIGEISKDALEYLKRSVDGCKLRLIEGLSLLMGDIVCGFALSVLLLVALFMLIAAMVVVLVPLIGGVAAFCSSTVGVSVARSSLYRQGGEALHYNVFWQGEEK